jgi:hypothetical protein
MDDQLARTVFARGDAYSDLAALHGFKIREQSQLQHYPQCATTCQHLHNN